MAPEAVQRLVPTDAVRSSDLLALAAAARRLGCDSVGRTATFDTLRETEHPAVVQLKNGHFIAVVGFCADSAEVVDAQFMGDLRSRAWSRARLEDEWTGRVLTITRRTAAR